MMDSPAPTTQAAIMKDNRIDFYDELSAMLLDGWRIVPQTFSVQSRELAPRDGLGARYITARGTTFVSIWFAVVERPASELDHRPEPEPA